MVHRRSHGTSLVQPGCRWRISFVVPPVSLFSGRGIGCLRITSQYGRNGTGIRTDAYRVDLIRRTAARGTTCGKPAFEIWEALAALAAFLFWFCVAVFVYSLFFQWPDGVAGDRRAQLAEALGDRYRVNVNYLPQTWSGGQVFTVDVTQDWDDPHYDEPAETTKASARLQARGDRRRPQPSMPGHVRGFEEVREAASTPTNTAGTRLCWRKPFRECRVREVTIPATSTQLVPHEQYMSRSRDYYEPEQMFP